MAEIITQQFDIFNKYWAAAQQSQTQGAVLQLLAEQGVNIDSVTVLLQTLPTRVTITLTNPSKIITLTHDIVRTKIVPPLEF